MRSGINALVGTVLILALFTSVALADNGSRGPVAAPSASTQSDPLRPMWIDGAGFTESFDDVTVLDTAGWVFANRSDPVGITGWYQGNVSVFDAHEGAATAYMAANFNSAGDAPGDINNWAFLPEWTLRNGDEFSFYTRAVGSTAFPDRLEVRLSIEGASTDTGVGTDETGDFGRLLLSINPELGGDYPYVWTEYRFHLSGLPGPGPTNGRLAFRYHVPDGGPAGMNGNYLGIDSVSYFSYQPGMRVQSTVGRTTDCEAGTVLALEASESYYLCHAITNEGNVALTGVHWTDGLGQTGDLNTLSVPVPTLVVGGQVTWVTGPHNANLAPDETSLVTTIEADWTGTNSERLADAQSASSAASIAVSHPPGPAVSLRATPLALADAEVSAGADTDFIAFNLEATGRSPVQVTGFRLDADIDSGDSAAADLTALLESLTVMLDGSEVASDAVIESGGVVLTLSVPLVISAGETTAVTIRATTRSSLALQLAGGALAIIGLGVALRSRRKQLLMGAALLLVLAACSGGKAPEPTTITFSAQLTGLTSNAEVTPDGLPLPGPTISVTF